MKYFLVIVVLLVAGFGCEKKPSAGVEAKAEAVKAEKKDELQPKKEEQQPQASVQVKPHTSNVPPTINQMLVDQSVPDVTLQVTSPENGATLEEGKEVAISFDLKGYRIDKELGQHVHVIVDNEPYLAHYDASAPVVLKDLKPGTHVIRTFPARHYHLALKTPGAFQTVIFHVGEKSKEFAFDSTKPYITYSRPKGKYPVSAGAEGLLLDYYVSNIELGKDVKVVYGVDGKETVTDKWEPVILPPLGPGEHTITLKLVDGEGKVIKNGGFNDNERKVVIAD